MEPAERERLAEYAGRLCYMSQHNPINRTTAEYLEYIKKQGHGSVLEHAVYVLLIEGISRSCSHELVRHRAGFGYSQISQRYVDESHAADAREVKRRLPAEATHGEGNLRVVFERRDGEPPRFNCHVKWHRAQPCAARVV